MAFQYANVNSGGMSTHYHARSLLNDSYFGLTEREKKALERSWAKVFADDVFPMIDEDRFECLYSSDKA